MKFKILILILISMFITGCIDKDKFGPAIDYSTVSNVDLEKFMGRWYEISRFPHSFEKNLVGVTADYSLGETGEISVINRGFKDTLQGKLMEAQGKGKIPDLEKPGMLKVSFFLFFYADYYILELDETNYQWVLVGSSTPDYLWILSRTPQLNIKTYNMLVKKALDRGYDIEKLIRVEQPVY